MESVLSWLRAVGYETQATTWLNLRDGQALAAVMHSIAPARFEPLMQLAESLRVYYKEELGVAPPQALFSQLTPTTLAGSVVKEETV
jgi:hypothetical protein